MEFWIFYFWKDIEDNALSLSCDSRLSGCLSALKLTKMGATKLRALLGIQLYGFYYLLLQFFLFIYVLYNSAGNTSEHTSTKRR
jgi:hypothetical protein